MATTHKFSTAQYAQGFIEGMIESMAKDLTEEQAAQLMHQWGIVSLTMDELIAENQDMDLRLHQIRSVLA